jgi:RNA polymerase sigma factor (sigma-70 family)
METPATRLTLLAMLQAEPTNDAAWAEFVTRYGPKVAQWCRAQRLAPELVEELTQEVLVSLFQGLKSFRYDPNKGRFRAYLYTVTRHTIARWFKKSAREPRTSMDDALRLVPAAEDDLFKRLQSDFDLERLYLAMCHIKRRVQPNTWAAFQATELDGRRAAQVGAELGLSVATVNVYRSRVRALVKEELIRLDGNHGTDSE